MTTKECPQVIFILSQLLFDVACGMTGITIKRGLHGSRESVMHKYRGFSFERAQQVIFTTMPPSQ
jgi:hypothetical protein